MTNSSFDIQLSHSLQAGGEPPDDGFTLRVMAELPAQSAARDSRWSDWLQHAHWAAISVAACGASALFQSGSPTPDPAQQLATYTLLGLLSFWSVPSRWSRP